MNPYWEINYIDFFHSFEEHLRIKLPGELKQFIARPDRNFIRLRYPQFHNAYYELQFSSSSPTHTEHFGDGPHVIGAFYYSTELGDSDIWLDVLSPHVKVIQEQLYRQVIVGPWNENWVWIAEKLDEESMTPENISCFFAQFIQATYRPITLAFQAIGR